MTVQSFLFSFAASSCCSLAKKREHTEREFSSSSPALDDSREQAGRREKELRTIPEEREREMNESKHTQTQLRVESEKRGREKRDMGIDSVSHRGGLCGPENDQRRFFAPFLHPSL